MDSIPDTKSWFRKFQKHLKKTGDSEPEQATIRLFVGAIVFIYYCLPWGEGERFVDLFDSIPNIIIITATIIALLLFSAIVRNPKPSPARRVIGISLDLTSLSILMYWTGGDHLPLFVFYLWVILGNGFRYGTNYLYISYGISLVGFLSVISWSQYWQQHQSFAVSLLIILIALPLYAAVLLKKLHAAIASAKHANEAKSRFLANMSHELRTPLNGVIGMGELLRETKLNDEQREIVQAMHSSADSLLKLIENVLDISKIEAGKINIENRPFDLHALVNSVIFMLSPLGTSKGIVVTCSIDSDTPFSLSGDQQLLRQILINLINNGIKFTDEGSVTLNVYKNGGTETNPQIRFDIIDTGIGIPTHLIPHIFDDFTQGRLKSSRSYGGTGLGTTISKELVGLMSGEIGVESEEFKGSKFWFELRFPTIPHDDNSISAAHILLLASEETATVVRPALSSWEIDFDWVRSSTRALNLMIQAATHGNHYNLVIVDQSVMTEINPGQFAQMVRSESLLETTSMILVNSSDTMINFNNANHYFISTILAPEDKRTLFNAIHAAQSVYTTEENVVTLAEFYNKQAGAKALEILVAEDNAVNQQVINGILKNAGHKVTLTDNGESVLDFLNEDIQQFDMLIIDMNMPKMDGIEVVKTLRFMDSTHSLPIIMLTADATPEAKARGMDAGASSFLTKPINSRTLLEKIASLSNQTPPDKPAIKPNSINRKESAGSTQNNNQSTLFNQAELNELAALGDGPEFIQTLVNNFILDGNRHIKRIQSSINDDYPEFREALHALKGSSTELSANKLANICLEGEKLKPYELGSTKIQNLADEIEKTYIKTIKALREAVKLKAKANNSI